MLLLDPDNRVSAAEALSLPYFSVFREPDDETEAQPYDHSLDNAELTVDQWKRKHGPKQNLMVEHYEEVRF